MSSNNKQGLKSTSVLRAWWFATILESVYALLSCHLVILSDQKRLFGICIIISHIWIWCLKLTPCECEEKTPKICYHPCTLSNLGWPKNKCISLLLFTFLEGFPPASKGGNDPSSNELNPSSFKPLYNCVVVIKIVINEKWYMIALPRYLYDAKIHCSKGWETSRGSLS